MKEPRFNASLSTPIGLLGLRFSDGRLTELAIDPDPNNISDEIDPPIIVKKALENYFKSGCLGEKLDQKIKLDPQGTKFQRAVWTKLLQIPDGKTATYGEIAKALKSNPRAVGNACRRNPIAILIPCHRVIASNGTLGGYAGHTDGSWLTTKEKLLRLEKAWS